MAVADIREFAVNLIANSTTKTAAHHTYELVIQKPYLIAFNLSESKRYEFYRACKLFDVSRMRTISADQ